MTTTAFKRAAGRPIYMDIATLSFHLCADHRTIEAWMRQGKFPQPYQLGGKRLWMWSEVEATIAASRDDVAFPAADPTGDQIYEAGKRITQGGKDRA